MNEESQSWRERELLVAHAAALLCTQTVTTCTAEVPRKPQSVLPGFRNKI